ncbi:MAG TPA: conditioned medium factor [Oceanospirillales bacterium]|nr:conditioned medium factor [Oceanospirillales bacterium]
MDTGNWDISVKTIGEPDQFEGFILASSASKYQLSSYKTNSDQIVDHNIHFVAQTTSNEKTIEALKEFNPINNAFMLVKFPNGAQQKVAMYDDGLHGDNLANDGLFGGDFKATEAGGYNVQINAYGRNPNGTPFFRTSEHFVPVIEQKISMNAKNANAFSISENRLNITMNVDNQAKSSNDRYRIIAEVWGQSATDKNMQPVSWISTITDVTKGQLNIELDGRWIAMANVAGNFELRNLRVEDAEHFIPLISRKSLGLKVASLPKAASKAFNGEITQEMLMGKRPTEKAVNKAGARLLLVHGYCSSDVWGPYAGQFASSSTFYDLNQNRTHDDFAQRIKNFGAAYSSFGVVAHSQGGAASLHLYTYYWSGLDNSSGNRLIQSVGTPYSGTPLAGNLAAIGDVFGVGCGVNSNLTTSGAASWLAGIPTWARNRVNYNTTSFATKWWRYDYCSIATDLFLSDPEDGVTEKSRGQLSGGINRGHKTGWCHTLSMRDPGQTSDSSRNADMSANANR